MDDLDHKNLGVKLKLWHLQEDAPGTVSWHPRGIAVYRVLEDYVRRKMRRAGYTEVRTPQLLPREFWGRSGHWDKFGEHMFRVDDGELVMALKPMSWPCHVQIFNKGLRSWRELPIRFAEFGACYRNEPSDSLHGIMRTRAFEQDDAHVFCREQDVEGEVACFIAPLGEAYRDLGFPDYEVALATPRGAAASRLITHAHPDHFFGHRRAGCRSARTSVPAPEEAFALGGTGRKPSPLVSCPTQTHPLSSGEKRRSGRAACALTEKLHK
jgi:threonyl-tRNA synthetase